MNYNKKIVNGTEYLYSSDWINKLESRQHWIFYWCQQKLMEHLIKPGDCILEIGVGSGFTANYLRSKGYNITTIDIDPGKHPDIVANIVSYEFKHSVDHVLAFEIMEHIPYDIFLFLLLRLRPVIKKYLFLSVPKNERIIFDMSFKIPKLSRRHFSMKIPGKKMATAHHWEIGVGGINPKKIEQEFEKAGFGIVERYFREQYICYYALR